jgi:hypothetical protein
MDKHRMRTPEIEPFDDVRTIQHCQEIRNTVG